MSVLAPLFFLGSLAIALPILFHLIRRAPSGRVLVSSLLFLQPSPPRISRRSRLDNWLLLLLRALALLLIAMAFARPFLRSSAETTTSAQTRYVALLVDRSASMRRGNAWQQALDTAGAEMRSLGRGDRVALMTFDSTTDMVRGFEAGSAAEEQGSAAVIDPRQALADAEPSWRGGDLGAALITAAESIEDAVRGDKTTDAERTIVVISDMQSGNSLAALRGFQWPGNTRIRLERVYPQGRTNASLGIAGEEVTEADNSSASRTVRVRVSNAAESISGNFKLRWKNSQGRVLGPAGAAITVPPGTTRVTRVAAPPESAEAIELVGDDHVFDNEHFVVVPEPVTQTVLYVGKDVEDPRASLLYYLERVSLESPYRDVAVRSVDPGSQQLADVLPLEPRETPLVVLHSVPPDEWVASLKRYLGEGGRVLMVLDSAATEPASTALVRELSGDTAIQVSSAAVDDYALLTGIDFSSSLFSAFADPRFSDFTKIQFWKHQSLALTEEDWWTLASFDDGDPALLRRKDLNGELFLLAAGWQATESQLALSTKFVPIIAGMIGEHHDARRDRKIHVGDMPDADRSETAVVRTPSGNLAPYRTAIDAQVVDRPGIYEWHDGEQRQKFAVNLPPGESETTPMDRSALEQLGIPFADTTSEVAKAESQRRLRDVELETRQQWWRVLILAALGLIGLETLLSARKGRTPPASTLERVLGQS